MNTIDGKFLASCTTGCVNCGLVPHTDGHVRNAAANLLREVWVNRRALNIDTDDVFQVLRVAPRVAAQQVLRLQIHEMASITPTSEEQNGNVEIAGVLNRPSRIIYLSKKFRTIERRFTLTHEVGHFQLHPGVEMHRDRPLDRTILRKEPRTRVEQEADLFAAEFLIPSKQLVPLFDSYFGGRIECDPANASLYYKLMVGTRRSQQEVRRHLRDPLLAALLVATTQTFGAVAFEPLWEKFAVSPTAMAIQLLDLDLVAPERGTPISFKTFVGGRS